MYVEYFLSTLSLNLMKIKNILNQLITITKLVFP